MATSAQNLEVSGFRSASRRQESFLASGERRLLVSLARRTPAWINSDHLTILGFAAHLLAGLSYALARVEKQWLFAAAFFLCLNWLGDSLDGTLARTREIERPRYGFYVDHMLDSLGAVALMGGLALSGYVSPFISLSLLVLFLLLSIQSYLATYTLGEFRLSFWSFGPTEVRLALIAGSFAALRWPRVLAGHYRLFDVGGVPAVATMGAMLVSFTVRNISRLYKEERIS
ncbi:MAG: CDP-alcohol phosphatidyltransferase family protein [Acidobacteria bacterium]|nr:CDP-alcohol phosphatidyltransferase family protein [Acidobacteriota bacterium]MBV9625140.1 CDP-alcohol phosphatidyltransferase family protein [Acidobacteriota bacterium]